MEPAKQVPIRRGTMPQQHAWVWLHRLATLRLRWIPNNEAYCERVPVDLLRRRHLRTTPNTWCGLHLALAAETKFEIVKANDNNNRMPSSLPVRRVYDFNPNIHGWKTPRGRPKTRWADSIKHDLNSADLDTTNAAQMVFDRPQWKAFF